MLPLRMMEGLKEALEMANEALNGELGEKEIELAKVVIKLRIGMLRRDIEEARKAMK